MKEEAHEHLRQMREKAQQEYGNRERNNCKGAERKLEALERRLTAQEIAPTVGSQGEPTRACIQSEI